MIPLLQLSASHLHGLLSDLLSQMQSLAAPLVRVGCLLGGAALLLEFSRVGLQVLMHPERGLDLGSLLHPLVLLLLAAFFPTLVLGTMNVLLSPIQGATSRLLQSETVDVERLLEKRQEALQSRLEQDPATAYLVSNEAFDRELESLGWSPSDLASIASMYMERTAYRARQEIREAVVEVLELLFDSAALVLDVLRTFFLAVLSILGPLSLGFSVFPLLRDSFPLWMARYIQVYLFLPLSDLFSSILSRLEGLILSQDISALEAGGETCWQSTDTVYILFMVMGVLGYLTIPVVATWVVQGCGIRDLTAAMGHRAHAAMHGMLSSGGFHAGRSPQDNGKDENG